MVQTPHQPPTISLAILVPNKINSKSVERLLQTLEINVLPSSVNQLYEKYYTLLDSNNSDKLKKLKALHSLVCEYQKIFSPLGSDMEDLDRLLLEIEERLVFYNIPFVACSTATQLSYQFGRRRYSLKEVDAMYDRYVSMYRKKYRSKKV